ncbi:DDE transposase [Holospora undulata]|uniref:Transposase DDE domain-containing protein n=1 Tax=Holospora undulata HU1 TaxID=1321371 RepID=A0A061JGW2_9PROT|nr:DDE transposase [Holospora undulata]ETZ04502.1 hypothetical protein K737_301092 [Holospora undulata HU1]
MGGKKIRKRHSGVDRQGNLLHITVHKANDRCWESYPTLKEVCADAGYRTPMEAFVRILLNKTIAISKRISQGWSILPTRWIVERTFAWLNHFRRVSKNHANCHSDC